MPRRLLHHIFPQPRRWSLRQPGFPFIASLILIFWFSSTLFRAWADGPMRLWETLSTAKARNYAKENHGSVHRSKRDGKVLAGPLEAGNGRSNDQQSRSRHNFQGRDDSLHFARRLSSSCCRAAPFRDRGVASAAPRITGSIY